MDNERYSVDEAIRDGVESLRDRDPSDKEYTASVENLRTLTDVKKVMDGPEKQRLSPNTIFSGVVMLVCVGATIATEIVGYPVFRKVSGFFNKIQK